MSKIRILPEQLANQIAAGEVVERPASVVKELVENSLDAGADRIEIEIEGGGTRLIRIIDNGEGMDEDDLLLSLERHGTSKIISEEDLNTIQTLGFRGEAIPSIGSVSRMTLISRRADHEFGTRAEIHFGKLVKVHEAGSSVGTIIEISNLFGKTPARRKFLRTVRTELNHIDEVVKNYGLAHPRVTFSLTTNSKRTIYLDNTLTLKQRLARIMHYNGSYIDIGDEKADSPNRRVYGFLVPPEKLHTGPARLRLFVNGRAIKDRMMSHGVAEGLRGFLMKGKNPAGLLHLVLPPSEIDVNVHPAKHEVRFRNSREVHFLISRTVAEAMQQEQTRLQSAIFGHPQEDSKVPMKNQLPAEDPSTPPPPNKQFPDTQQHYNRTPPLQNVQAPEPFTAQQERSHIEKQPSQPPPSLVRIYDNSKIIHSTTSEPPAIDIGDINMAPIPETGIQASAPQPASLLPQTPAGHELEVIGQFKDLYIFCRSKDGLVVIDQHAAHERLLYEDLRNHYMEKRMVRQTLLFPETVELSIFQTQLVEKHGEELDHMGFTIREFGGTSFIISAVPALAGQCNPMDLLQDVLEQFGSQSTSRETGQVIDMILATVACKAAVKAGTALGPQEIEALLMKMARADLFSHCPHGRPVVKNFSPDEIKKWFYRT